MRLSEYKILNKDVFYRCEHILEYIKRHPNMDELEKMSIKSTIMDALVHNSLIDKDNEFLDYDNLEINSNQSGYKYEEKPDISGIPFWMKEEFRKHCLVITGGIPISMFLAKPASKAVRYCVYDPNTAVSAIFDDAVFYETLYTSPTRHIKLDKSRPFVEVKINGEDYLVDVLTKRIIKSSFFKENFGLEIVSEQRVSKLRGNSKKYYKEVTSEQKGLADYLFTTYPLMKSSFVFPEFAEMEYEVEKTKNLYPEEWEEKEKIEEKMLGLRFGGN